MRDLYTNGRSTVLRWSLVALLLAAMQPLRAQETCMLVPVSLTERVAGASLIVEAGVGAQEVLATGGHLYTLSELTVYKVFRGTVPARLRLADAGGTLGLRREVVSTSVALKPKQQGLFLLEPDPALPGAYRLVTGPQGWVQYDLTDRSASEPFGRYASIAGNLYPAVEGAVGQPRRVVLANTALAAPVVAARPQAQPVVSGFSPSQLSAGRGDVLTINGSNFGVTQGNGHVDFPNGDNGGSSFVSANSTDYLTWSDTQIQVRVPSLNSTTGGVAGTGNFRVVNNTSETGTSPTRLTVVYALSNLANGAVINRPRLINQDGAGGYTLQYSPSFTAVAGAPAAFERALATWECATRLRRVVNTSTAAPEATTNDGTNAVRFGTLSAGVLGVTNSYYSGCFVGGAAQFSLDETDYTFRPIPTAGTTWQFGPAAPSSAQYDFESVALHEQGHGTQLTHIIDVTAVMHFALTNGQAKRTLSTASDAAGAQDVFTYSLSNPCGDPAPVATAVPTRCTALPVELLTFEAHYEAGRGTVLTWATAQEKNSAYFAVETHDAAVVTWPEVVRLPAAGSSSSARQYTTTDARSLMGTRYYRLRQVDQDGTVVYSPVVAVSGPQTGLSLYPNPAENRLQVQGLAGVGRLVLYDAVGREAGQFGLPAGNSEVDVSSLPAGLYQAKWTDGTTVRWARLEKR
ncbi:IPT/TIG domain-containing protein [Hymenobacter negativus]|uniref:T9SS type A sorting domain-containing protein n=1 Tax=Hymenobacter negativus TaxID=2795026 RepID=A0ABS3QN61_9BACT|nr:IPT/TIG domain-containing protein [Hymenobacter negativus]MBO2012671.1 T9SS type A sorting domain-containing protein [Hymenobacter negativus]